MPIDLIITYLIKALLLGWLLSAFKPLKDAFGIIDEFIPESIFKLLFNYAITIFSCWTCCATWSAIFISHDIYIAAAAGLIAFKADRYINIIKF